MPPRTTFALADRQKDSCLHPSRPKRNIIQKEKAGNAPSLAHEKGHRQTHRQTTTTLIASGPPLRGDPYFVCISTTLLRNNTCTACAPRNAGCYNLAWPGGMIYFVTPAASEILHMHACMHASGRFPSRGPRYLGNAMQIWVPQDSHCSCTMILTSLKRAMR